MKKTYGVFSNHQDKPRSCFLILSFLWKCLDLCTNWNSISHCNCCFLVSRWLHPLEIYYLLMKRQRSSTTSLRDTAFYLIVLSSFWLQNYLCSADQWKKRRWLRYIASHPLCSEQIHISFIHLQLGRTSHMTPPSWKGCWDTQSLEE
jgi:hypothetical protein